MKVLTRLVAVCLSAALMAPGAAAAQGKGGAAKSAPAKADASKGGGAKAGAKEETPKEKAAPYLKGGAKAAAAGEWDDAYAEYQIAWSIHRDWEIAGGLGKASFKTGHFAEAIQRLEVYLKDAPAAKVSAKERSEAEGMIREARAKTGTIVLLAPDGSDVLVDGEDIGKTPLGAPVPLDPGKHKIEVRQGTKGETKEADVAAGAMVTLDFTPPKAPPPKTVIVKEEGVFTPQVRTAAVIGGGALALGGLAAGGVMLGLSFAKADEKKKAELDPFGFDQAKAASQAQADAMNAALWCFVGGGAAAVGTGVFYLVTRPRVKAPVEAGAVVGPQGGSIWIHGQF